MSSADKKTQCALERQHKRYPYLQDLTAVYEGYDAISTRAPDLSSRGMFLNTTHELPEGSVLKLKFRLPRSNVAISTRAEVRYCLPGVGVGLEFIEMSDEAQRAIEEELAMANAGPVSES